MVFVNSASKDNHVSMPKSNLQQLEDHDEDIFATTIHDQYAAHPQTLEDITLAEFATSYTTS